MKVIIVEDDTTKFGRIFRALELDGLRRDDVVHAVCAADAVEELGRAQFDLMLLDVNIPRRLGEGPTRGGGLQILTEIQRNENLRRPTYVVGITAYANVIEEFGDAFEDALWSLILYSETSDRWISQLRTKIAYIRAARQSMNFSDGQTFGVDFAIVCALADPELAAVKELPLDWQPLRLPHDETRYHSGSMVLGDANVSVIAASAPRMGMPASAVLTAKMIHQFRPRYLVMLGICAGRTAKVNIGDIVIAEPTWDWGSGKIGSVDGKPHFQPLPHQLDMDVDVVEQLRELSSNRELLEDIRARAQGEKPGHSLVARLGPLASGASVIANAPTFDSLVENNRALLGIDMEAYGIAAACLGSGKPRPHALTIKAVCDFADEVKNDDYQPYAASVSALFFYEAMKVLP